MLWTEQEENYRQRHAKQPTTPLPHYELHVWEAMKKLYPNMTADFWDRNVYRVRNHCAMGLTIERSIDELKPFAEAQINSSRRYSELRPSEIRRNG